MGTLINTYGAEEHTEGTIFFLNTGGPVNHQDGDALSTNEQKAFIRQCAFFLTDVIELKEEYLFCKRLVYKFIYMFFDKEEERLAGNSFTRGRVKRILKVRDLYIQV